MGKAKDLKKKKLLEQINEFSKVAGYKIKITKWDVRYKSTLYQKLQ